MNADEVREWLNRQPFEPFEFEWSLTVPPEPDAVRAFRFPADFADAQLLKVGIEPLFKLFQRINDWTLTDRAPGTSLAANRVKFNGRVNSRGFVRLLSSRFHGSGPLGKGFTASVPPPYPFSRRSQFP